MSETTRTSDDARAHRAPRRASRRSGAFLLSVALGLVAAGAATGCTTPPQKNDNDKQQQGDADRQKAEERRKQIADLSARLGELEARFPAQADVDRVFEEVRALVDKNHLALAKRAASGSEENARPLYTEVSRAVDLTGSFPDVQAFLRDLGQFERPLGLSNVTVRRAPDEGKAAIALGFTLTAYYLSDPNRQQLEAGMQGAAPAPAAPSSGASNENAAPAAPAAGDDLATLDERVKTLKEHVQALEDLRKSQQGPAAAVDLVVSKIPPDQTVLLDKVTIQNDAIAISGDATKEESVTAFGRALQNDTSGLLHDVAFKADRAGATGAAATAPDSGGATAGGKDDAKAGGAGQPADEAFTYTINAKYTPTKATLPAPGTLSAPAAGSGAAGPTN